MKEKLVIGTRGSDLALWQAERVRSELQKVTDREVELRIISTRGDEQLQLSLHSNRLSKGLFTEELEHELLNEEIDFAVHSLKDLPVEMPEGLVLGGILQRGDARDALLLHKPQEGKIDLSGLHVGTSSPRRLVQLKEATTITLSPDTTFAPIRGNVPTRIRKLRNGEYDATILALAGLQRLGLEQEADFILPLDVMLPAPGQGAVAIQCAESNLRAIELAGQINDTTTERATYIERRLLQLLGGGCALPLGAYCEIQGSQALLRVVYTPDIALPSVRTVHQLTLGSNLEQDLIEVAQKIGAR
ncbi:MAG: hydroxymethylbilane synthase [Porphyromonas sp.]|nr:hydroxymethylbilane synthase [Porphyromonas sp.]